MINFVRTVPGDTDLIKSWIDADPWHTYKDDPEWWIKGEYLVFKLVDKQGITMFVRFDEEKDSTLVRLHTQFAPVSEVSQKRVALSVLEAIPRFCVAAASSEVTGIISELMSPQLAAFMCTSLNFKPVAGSEMDYVLMFSEGK